MFRVAPVLLILLAGCTSPLSGDAHEDGSGGLAPETSQPTVPIAAIFSEYPGQVTVVVEVLQADGSTPPRQVYQFIAFDRPVTPAADRDPLCGAPTELRIATVDGSTGEELQVRSIPYACDGVDLVLVVEENANFMVAPLNDYAEMPRSWQRGDGWPGDESGASQAPPALQFAVSDDGLSLRVVSAATGADWHHLIFKTSSDCGYVLVQGGSESKIQKNEPVSDDASSIEIGDRIALDYDGDVACVFWLQHSSGDADWGTFELREPSSGDKNVASFPNVSVKEASTAGVIEMEHLGGHCIDIPSDYTFRVNDGTVTPRTARQGGSMAQDFCVGDKIYFDGVDGMANEILVIDEGAQSQVYQKTIQL